MLSCALQSGSNGNCIYVETGDVRLLFDAGISGRSARERLAEHGRDVRAVDALLVTHNHSDHVCGVGVFHRMFKLPVYATGGTWRRCQGELGKVEGVRCFEAGAVLTFGETLVYSVATAHDGTEGVAYVVESQGVRLGIFTDLGHRFKGIEQWVESLDGMYLESNYDPEMLARGDYPQWLKNRVSGSGGHLSNEEAGRLVADCGGRLRFWVLSHLSANNNRPELALATARGCVGGGLALSVASRTGVSEMMEL